MSRVRIVALAVAIGVALTVLSVLALPSAAQSATGRVTVQTTVTSTSPGTVRATASCPIGLTPSGGGFLVRGGTGDRVIGSSPTPSGWLVQVFVGSAGRTVGAYAVCD